MRSLSLNGGSRAAAGTGCLHRLLPLFLLVLLSLCFHSSLALSDTLKLNDDARPAFHVRSFGFSSNGRLDLFLRNLRLRVPPALATNSTFDLAFVIERADEPTRVDALASGVCFHREVSDADVISLASRTDWNQKGFHRDITEPGNYHIYFSNCVKDSSVSFTLGIIENNVDANGRSNYLGVGKEPLPTIHFVFTGVFALQLVVWLALLHKRREDVKLIHLLMTAVLVFKVFTVLFDALKYHTLANYGHHDGWAIAFYVFNTIRGFLMFSVIVLIGTGWSHLKPFLTERDKQIMLVVLVTQVLVNIAWIVIEVTAPGSAGWLRWQDLLHILDMLCCCVLLFPIYWSIRHLQQEAERDGKVATSLQRLQNFRSFYILVIVYIYFTRIVIFLLSTALSYRLAWLPYLFREAAMFCFFAYVGKLFRPQSLNPYLALESFEGDDFDVPSAAASSSSSVVRRAGAGAGDVEMGAANGVGMGMVSNDDEFDDDPVTDDPHMRDPAHKD